MKTAYEHLQTMCSDEFIQECVYVNAHTTGLSHRLNYIKSNFRSGEVDSYEYNGTPGHNFYRHIDVGAESTIVFLAHHDVVVLAQQNCNDNTASCCHLIELAHRFSKNRNRLKHNVVLAWVDHEERCSTPLAGSSQLAKRIKEGKFGNVVGVINLELTAVGEYFWYNPEGRSHKDLSDYLEVEGFEKVFTPLNDAVHLDRYGVSAICIGNFRAEDRAIVVEQKRAGCKLWASCHSKIDTVEMWAVEADMIAFNQVLYRMAFDYTGKTNAVYDEEKQYMVRSFKRPAPAPRANNFGPVVDIFEEELFETFEVEDDELLEELDLDRDDIDVPWWNEQ